mmetsp:Transcript_38212/g.114348  ORF Transcript_38212/g.114348 Transcript_38212/m.114348 type:complete len:227 (+) Transcript_38212:435-1115(+)
MSEPYCVSFISGARAPAPAIICWQTGFSARQESAPVAAACAASSVEESIATSGATAPDWQISSEWKLSASEVGSSIASVWIASAASACLLVCSEPSMLTSSGSAPPTTTADRNMRACSRPASAVAMESWPRRATAASRAESEPCCSDAMISVSWSDISAASPIMCSFSRGSGAAAAAEPAAASISTCIRALASLVSAAASAAAAISASTAQREGRKGRIAGPGSWA